MLALSINWRHRRGIRDVHITGRRVNVGSAAVPIETGWQLWASWDDTRSRSVGEAVRTSLQWIEMLAVCGLDGVGRCGSRESNEGI